MKTICLCFQVHQPYRLKPYRFFDIGHKQQYFHHSENKRIMQQVATRCYLPSNQLLLELLKQYPGHFKVSFSITGTAIEQMQQFSPDALESFQQLATTDNVEFLAETYYHSLTSLKNVADFKTEIKQHSQLIKKHFGLTPSTFRNTELLYNDTIAKAAVDLGFRTILSEGSRQILKWKSPNFVYQNASFPEQKILLRNYKFSDDIAFRFSNKNWDEYPLTAEKYLQWIEKSEPGADVVNVFMDYETFGEHHNEETGIFLFLKNLVKHGVKNDFLFATPAEVSKQTKVRQAIRCEKTISWADKERDESAWLGNEMQQEAFEKLYQLRNWVVNCADEELQKTWHYLQSSDHFYYMSTKKQGDGMVHAHFNPYANPHDAFLNFMNILNDFTERLKR